MRKIITLFIVLLSLLSLPMYSQKDISTALSLSEGENTYADKDGIYWVYTAPIGQDKLVKFEMSYNNETLQASEDGTYATEILAVTKYADYKVSYWVPVKKGQKVYFKVSNNGSESDTKFTASLSDIAMPGQTCDEALPLLEGQNTFVASYKKDYDPIPGYYSYTASEDGVFAMTAVSSLSDAKVSDGCDGKVVSINFLQTDDNNYMAKYEMKAGKTYIFSISTYSPSLMTVSMTHPKEGSSCDYPIQAQDGSNILEKSAGSYWYQYIATKTGYAMVNSSSELPGGSIIVKKSCSDYGPFATADSAFVLRFATIVGEPYLINIKTKKDYSADVSFNVSTEDAKDGDSFDSPQAVPLGETNLPLYNGTYYYSITIPDTINQFLVVKAKKDTFLSAKTGAKVFLSSDQWSSLGEGTYFNAQVKGGNTYVIVWTCDEGKNAFPFDIAIKPVEKGDVITDPIDAVSGKNQLPETIARFYCYRATTDGWMKVTSDDAMNVSFPKGTGKYDGYYYPTSIKGGSKIEVSKGKDYLLAFNTVEKASVFTISESDFAEGESCMTATVVKDSVTLLASAPDFSTWYVLKADKDGVVYISSNIKDESSGNPYFKMSDVTVKMNGCSDVEKSISKYTSAGKVFGASFILPKDSLIYVHVSTITAQSDKMLKLVLKDAENGQTKMTAIKLQPGEVMLSGNATANVPYWYYVDAMPGNISFTVQNDNNFAADLLSEDGKLIAKTQYIRGNNEDGKWVTIYGIQAKVNDAAKYYVRVKGGGNGANYKATLEYTVPNTANITFKARSVVASQRVDLGLESIKSKLSDQFANVFYKDSTYYLVPRNSASGRDTLTVEYKASTENSSDSLLLLVSPVAVATGEYVLMGGTVGHLKEMVNTITVNMDLSISPEVVTDASIIVKTESSVVTKYAYLDVASLKEQLGSDMFALVFGTKQADYYLVPESLADNATTPDTLTVTYKPAQGVTSDSLFLTLEPLIVAQGHYILKGHNATGYYNLIGKVHVSLTVVTSVKDHKTDGVVSSSNGSIVFSTPDAADIYDMSGRLIVRKASGRKAVVNVSSGIYIVNVNGQVIKLLVK